MALGTGFCVLEMLFSLNKNYDLHLLEESCDDAVDFEGFGIFVKASFTLFSMDADGMDCLVLGLVVGVIWSIILTTGSDLQASATPQSFLLQKKSRNHQ